MQQSQANRPSGGPAATLVRLILTIGVPLLTLGVLYWGFFYLRDSSGPKELTALIAIVWGVGGVAALYLVANWTVEQFNDVWRARIQPFIFVGPAVSILMWYLAVPTARTFWVSLFDRTSTDFVGLSNYIAVFTNRNMFTAFRNNLLWIVFGATASILFGLLIAVLADRSNFERVSKSLIFMPMAISMVGAGVIWNMIYDVNPNIGMLNAIYTNLSGNIPIAWKAAAQIAPWNNLFLIVVMVWLQTGYAMVLFSAAIKGIPGEIVEAGRIDGANEIQVFFSIMIPYIMGTIITVSTTVLIFSLKIFDVVQVMTGGQFGTQVIATQFYREYFTNQNAGFGSAIAIVLLITVIPVMVYNLRQLGDAEAF